MPDNINTTSGEMQIPGFESGPFSIYPPEFRSFLKEHPDWKERLSASSPIYAIPLAACNEAHLSFFFPDQDSRAAEVEYAKLCNERGIIGFWKGTQLQLKSLTTNKVSLAPAEIEWLKSVSSKPMLVDKLLETMNPGMGSIGERILGTIGWCKTDPSFMGELKTIRGFYDEIPPESQPSLDTLRPMAEAADVGKASENNRYVSDVPALDRYLGRVLPFLEKWGISRLLTWDWLIPEAPATSGYLADGNPSKPRHTALITIPPHFHLMNEAELLKDIRRQQTVVAQIQGLPEGLVDLQKFKVFAQLARLIHLETTLRSRFEGELRRGGVDKLCEMAATYLVVEADVVRRYRGFIKRCLSGERHLIPDLN